MHKIEYEVALNDSGRLYIGLPDNYEDKPEDRFFAIEVTRYLLQDLLKRRKENLDTQTISAMDEAERLLGQIGDEVAVLLYDGMKASGEMTMMLDTRYHVWVNSVEERDNLPDKNIIHNNKIFDRVEGLRVGLNGRHKETNFPTYHIYELKGGITNENWEKIS